MGFDERPGHPDENFGIFVTLFSRGGDIDCNNAFDNEGVIVCSCDALCAV